MIDEQILDSELEGLSGLQKVSVDSSSIIAAQRAGFLDLIEGLLELRKADAVLLELEGLARNQALPPADRAVLDLARAEHIPVLAEDRRILQAAQLEGIEAYNLGIVLALPVLRGKLEPEEAEEIFERFQISNPYRKKLAAYCRALLFYLRRKL